MNFFLIGLGSIGTKHARNLIALGHTVWGYDKSIQTALAVKEQLPELEIAADMFDCDAYVICTSPDQHIAEMINAVAAGKHIFVEKPIGVPEDIRRLELLLTTARRDNLVVMVGSMLRFHPKIRDVRPYVVGPYSKVMFQVLQKNERYTEPVILNWGAHEIDLALYLFGPAKVTDAMGGEKRAWVHLLHENGTKSSIDMDYLTEPEIRKFEVDLNGTESIVTDLRLPDWNDVYMDEMLYFCDLIIQNQRHAEGKMAGFKLLDGSGATGEDGLATLKIIADAMRMMADAS